MLRDVDLPVSDNAQRVRYARYISSDGSYLPVYIGGRNIHDSVVGASCVPEVGGYAAECELCRQPERQGDWRKLRTLTGIKGNGENR